MSWLTVYEKSDEGHKLQIPIRYIDDYYERFPEDEGVVTNYEVKKDAKIVLDGIEYIFTGNKRGVSIFIESGYNINFEESKSSPLFIPLYEELDTPGQRALFAEIQKKKRRPISDIPEEYQDIVCFTTGYKFTRLSTIHDPFFKGCLNKDTPECHFDAAFFGANKDTALIREVFKIPVKKDAGEFGLLLIDDAECYCMKSNFAEIIKPDMIVCDDCSFFREYRDKFFEEAKRENTIIKLG